MSLAVVIGGSGGLGRAICRRLAEGGDDLVLTYRGNATAAEEAAAGARAAGRSVEVRRLALEDEAAVSALFAGRDVDTVVHAAGAPIEQPFVGEIEPAVWRRVVDAEVHGFFHLVRAALPSLRRTRGSIVAITSAGLLRYPPRDALSVAPKAAITALVVAVAREEGRHGVRANCVAPGVIEAGIFLRLREGTFRQDELDAMRRNTALRRFGSADDVAGAVAFLARAPFVTGQTLAVDGGYSL
jgi:NAD(P)-dependent dehydrogenase (short-subunit alcohol dehydrogenase family)